MSLSLGFQKELINPNLFDLWDDSLAEDFYMRYYQSLDSKGLDKEFNKGLKTLTNLLNQLPESERKDFTDILAVYIGFYMENKIEREIEDSLLNMIKF